MNKQYHACLNQLVNTQQQHLLTGGLKGIEKESLRITPTGSIAQTAHPAAFGSALSHPHITTDYSEALLEFITPPFEDINDTLLFLKQIHQYVYQHLDDELLWASSMPCGLEGNDSIPIAHYGHSNIGRMKHIYRRGLDHRYGRAMQVIAGIHFNYSVPVDFWPVFQDFQKNSDPLQTFISSSYFGMIRNLQRYGWLILYLFGASPTICKSFLQGRKHTQPEFLEYDQGSFYLPYATSLRMSDIGYTSASQSGLNISFNHLDEYVETLTRAIETPYPDYQAIGVKVNGEYRQLNDSILQIENEYYSSVRPKQVIQSGEKPTLALKHRGVQYVEIRSTDINPFMPLGCAAEQFRFIEALLLMCQLSDSPLHTPDEKKSIKSNMLATAYRGRDPSLMLDRNGQAISLQHWAGELCESMSELCEILDENEEQPLYSQALEKQIQAIQSPELTPSAKILANMKDHAQPFAGCGLNTSRQHQYYFNSLPALNNDQLQQFKQEAEDSLRKQALVESGDRLPFDQYLQQYFAQR